MTSHIFVPNRCLLCYTDKVDSGLGTTQWNNPGSSSTIPAAPQLPVVFILRNLLEVPGHKIDEYLHNFGSPDHWVKLCSNCGVLVNHANSIYQQLIQISRLFNDTKRKVVEAVKQGPFQNGGIVGKHMLITEECRRFGSQVDVTRLIVDTNQAPILQLVDNNPGMGGEYPPLSYFKALQDNLQIIVTTEDSSAASGENSSGDQNQKVKPFQCTICPTAFTQKGNLTRHVENVHKKKHRFACNQCGKCWTKNADLKKHLVKVHNVQISGTSSSSSTSPYFNNNGHWTHHANNNANFKSTKKKPGRQKKEHFSCDLCHVTFTQKGNLARHMENVHQGNHKFSCDQCGMRWAKNADWKKHMTSVHGGNGS